MVASKSAQYLCKNQSNGETKNLLCLQHQAPGLVMRRSRSFVVVYKNDLQNDLSKAFKVLF